MVLHIRIGWNNYRSEFRANCLFGDAADAGAMAKRPVGGGAIAYEP